MTIIQPVLEVARIHQHAKVQAIPSVCSPGNSRKPQIWPVKIVPIFEQSKDHDHKLFGSEGVQDTWVYKIADHSLHVFSGECPETFQDRRMDGHAAKRSRLVGWTNGPMYRWKEGVSGFGRTDGRTDGGTARNIISPALKGGGITVAVHRTYIKVFIVLDMLVSWNGTVVLDWN